MPGNTQSGAVDPRLIVGAIHLREAARSILQGSPASSRESLKVAAMATANGAPVDIGPLTKVQAWVGNLFQVDLSDPNSGTDDQFGDYAAFESEAAAVGKEAPDYAAGLLLGLANQLEAA